MNFKLGTAGDDSLFVQMAQAGTTLVLGKEGNDSLLGVVHDLGQASFLNLFGGNGNDTMVGAIVLRPNQGAMESKSFITIDGGSGNDTLLALSGYLLLDGGDGSDLLWSFHGSEMNGGSGDDTIIGGGNPDDSDDYNVIDGGSGQDFIICGPVGDGVTTDDGEADVVEGGDGDDDFSADFFDFLTGGLGADRFSFSAALVDRLVEGATDVVLGDVINDFTADEGDFLSVDLGDLSDLHPQVRLDGHVLVVSTDLGRATFDLDGLVDGAFRLVTGTDSITDPFGRVMGTETTVEVMLVGQADPWGVFTYQQYIESSPFI